MEMPEKCSECRFQSEHYYCSAMEKEYCGYTWDDDGKPDWCPLIDANPRMLTLGEAQEAQYVFIETRKWVDGDYHGIAIHKDTDYSDCLTEFLDSYGCELTCDNSMYNDNWRCWDKKPTQEQTMAVKWNG